MWQCYYLPLPKSPNKDRNIAAKLTPNGMHKIKVWNNKSEAVSAFNSMRRYWTARYMMRANMSASSQSKKVAFADALITLRDTVITPLKERVTHWCTCPPVCPCRRGNSRCDSRRVWQPRWWSDCWVDTADIILPPGKTWRCPEGKLKRKRERRRWW